MKVLALASQKGGVGKTTLSGHLAVEAERAGFGRVALVDTDPQHSLKDWWDVRKAETPILVHVVLSALPAALVQLKAEGIDLVIVDTPPAITESIRAVVRNADLVLIPTRPSPHDLRAVGATVDVVEGENRRMIFVINGAANRARITAQAATALSQHGAVAPVIIIQRTDFASSMTDGRTVTEIDPNGKSAAEIGNLWTYVSKHLIVDVSKGARKGVRT